MSNREIEEQKSLLKSDERPSDVAIEMNDNDQSLGNVPECGCTNCDDTNATEQGDGSKNKQEVRDWRYWSIRFGITALAVTLGFLVSHYITAFFLGGVAVKAGFGTVGAKLASTKVGAKVAHFFAARSTGGQCCCCTCGGCNGCCPCGNACCSCAC
jgi:hypothetical protein